MNPFQNEQRQRATTALQTFLTTPLSTLLTPVTDGGRTTVLNLFHNVAETVPAYQKFLAEHDIIPNHIQTFAEFQTLPLITKENYLKHYSLPELCRQG